MQLKLVKYFQRKRKDKEIKVGIVGKVGKTPVDISPNRVLRFLHFIIFTLATSVAGAVQSPAQEMGGESREDRKQSKAKVRTRKYCVECSYYSRLRAAHPQPPWEMFTPHTSQSRLSSTKVVGPIAPLYNLQKYRTSCY